MAKLHGITVTLYNREETGRDALNNPIYGLVASEVDNVLIGSPSSSDITSSIDLDGKRIDYVLGIPKGDENTWTDALVSFFGGYYETLGEPIAGHQDLIPLSWGQNVKVARFDGGAEDWLTNG